MPALAIPSAASEKENGIDIGTCIWPHIGPLLMATETFDELTSASVAFTMSSAQGLNSGVIFSPEATFMLRVFRKALPFAETEWYLVRMSVLISCNDLFMSSVHVLSLSRTLKTCWYAQSASDTAFLALLLFMKCPIRCIYGWWWWICASLRWWFNILWTAPKGKHGSQHQVASYTVDINCHIYLCSG